MAVPIQGVEANSRVSIQGLAAQEVRIAQQDQGGHAQRDRHFGGASRVCSWFTWLGCLVCT